MICIQFRSVAWRRQWHPTRVLLPGKSHGWRSLVGCSCSPWGREESDTTERLHFHFSLSCIEEGNGTPLQCSRLENPREGRAWWATIYGVEQIRIQLKQLRHSSSSSVAQSCPTLCDPMNRSTPGLPVHHQLLEFTQTHVHRVSDHPEGLSKGPSKGKTCSQLENGGRVINKNKQKPNYQLNCKNMKDQI